MSIDPTAVHSGGAATLSWNSTNVTNASIDQGVGSVALSGSKVVTPTTNTTYTGTFTGPGGTVTCQASITITQAPVPQCTLSVSASKIKTGQSVMVSWTSLNVSQGFINAVGTTTPVSGGSAEVFPPDNTTYTGTFSGPHGSVTCSAPVEVEKGSTGCQGNCGGGLNQPNVVMLQKPPEAPLAFVTLDQIPYTGFEAGKALTLLFWLAVGLLAATGTYFVMGHRVLQFVIGTQMPGVLDTYGGSVESRSTLRSVATASHPVPTDAPVYPPPSVQAAATTDIRAAIENHAHAASVLISPEAVELAAGLATDATVALARFDSMLEAAIRTYPREEGWVMLTSDRFESLRDVREPSTQSVEEILNAVMPAPAPVLLARKVEMPMANADDQSVVLSLARAIVSGARDQAYTIVRTLEVNGAKPATVLTVIAGAFDQLYRARRHGLTTVLSADATGVSDETLSQLVETFTRGMDADYANPFTALKLAVAQAFEERG